MKIKKKKCGGSVRGGGGVVRGGGGVRVGGQGGCERRIEVFCEMWYRKSVLPGTGAG